MKIGISALIHEMDKAIEICQRNTCINHIELGIDNLNECEKLLIYASELNLNNISLGIHLPMELNTCENIEYINKAWIEFIIKMKNNLINMDIQYFNMHLGYVIKTRYEKNKKKYLDNTIEFLKKLDIDSDVFIENTYSNGGDICNVGTTSYEFEYIFNSISNVEFCYDTGHNLINKDDFIVSLRHKINLIHLSDNDGITDSHLQIGKGKLNLDNIEDLINLKPKFIIIEVGHENIDESVKLLERFI